MIGFRFDLKHFDQVTEGLTGLLTDLSDLTPYFRKHFVPAYLQTMQLQFESEGGFVGGWEGLDPTYERWKEARYPGRLILERTRKLRRSFSPDGRSKYLEVEYRPRSARIRSVVQYAEWVNQARKIMVPPRRLNAKKYTMMLEKYLTTVTEKHLGRSGKRATKFSNEERGTGGSGGFLGNIGR